MNSPDEPSNAVPPGSITNLLVGLRSHDEQAIAKLWVRYFQPLVELARTRLCGVRGAPLTGEDIALEAFLSFCEEVARPDSLQRFPNLEARQNIWKLLVCFTVRRAFDHATKSRRQAAVLQGESAFGEQGLAALATDEPTREFGLAVLELLDLLPNEEYRQLARRRMEGHTVAQIAEQLECSVAKVERRLKIIRELWKEHRPTRAPQ